MNTWPVMLKIFKMDWRYKKMFEDTKGVIRSHKSKDRQYNGQMKNYKRTNNDLQNITKKTKDRATRTPLKPGWIQFLLHMWHPSCYSRYKPGEKSWMRKRLVSNYDKRNISMVVCEVMLINLYSTDTLILPLPKILIVNDYWL